MKIFQQIQINKEKSNSFDLSHDKKLSFNMGELVPMLCQEVIPGDTFNVQSEQLIRLAPMVAPMMHKVDVYTHFFYVPNRILWSRWEDFITGTEENQPIFPVINAQNIRIGGLSDNLGYPTESNNTLESKL
ncbi:major capsid protein, partial [Flavobacterium sp.]|uniref:major capsid protein n=1 Tax=Flavobacterium sp. TaxID=239 RepID=UPI0037522142